MHAFILEIYPQTEAEADRQRSQHYLFKYIFQSSYFAPIQDILIRPDAKTLDIGCGSYPNWVIDLASDFPESTFYGLDILKPSLSDHIPSNCNIYQQDILQGLSYDNETFDYVHQRMMYMTYHSATTLSALQEILRVTKDNGFIEFVEPDTMPKRIGPLFKNIFTGVQLFMKDHLGDPLEGKSLVRKMTEAGIVDIKSDYCSVPVCWGGYVGKLIYEDLLILFNHLGPFLFDYLDLGTSYDKEKLNEYLDNAFNECVEYQTFINIQWAYGRKPSKIDNHL